MKSLIVATLLSCFAMQVFVQGITRTDIRNAMNECFTDGEQPKDTKEIICYYEDLEVLEDGQIIQKKLEEYFSAMYQDLTDAQSVKLAKMCAEEGNKGKDDEEKVNKLVQCIDDKFFEVKDSK